MQRGHAQRGAVLPLIAICLAVLMGFAGLSVDVGFLEYKQQAQQSATDAAAMGGAEAAYADGCQSSTAATSAAKADATLNGYTNAGNGSLGGGSGGMVVTVNNPPATGVYASNTCAVSVAITNPTVQTFFSKVLTGTNVMAESTQAVGVASQNNPGCIWLLTTAQQSDLSNSHITAPGCNIYINDSANMSNATINAAYIGYGSGSNNTSGTTFTNATPAPMGQVSDPCPQMPGCAYLTNNAPTCSTWINGSNYSGNMTLGAANTTTCFTSLSMSNTSGAGATMCGLIVVGNGGGSTAQLHLNNTTITSCASGVTIEMESNVSDTNFSNGILTLAAPTTGNTRGVLLWRNSAQSNSVNLSAGTYAFTGLLYFPTSQVNYSSASGSYNNLVFGQGNFSTSTGLNLGSPPPNGTIALKATLAE
jgi:hypothetical protein